MNPIEVRLVLQGGGAKLALLLAAAEGISTLVARKQLKISSIVGTSAGAIVGAFLAAGRDIAQVRADLLGKSGSKLRDAYKMPSLPTILCKALRGTPLWSQHTLGEWLREQFAQIEKSSNDGRNLTFDDVKRITGTDLTVVATNLSTGRRFDIRGASDVVGSLLSSAGIPFCFRTWKSPGDILVDGGLCKNLPAEAALGLTKDRKSTVLVSFPSVWNSRPTGILSFTKALIDVAIDESVVSSKNTVDAENLCILQVDDTQISTFSFESALDFLASDKYEKLKLRVIAWFEKYIAFKQARKAHENDSSKVLEDFWDKEKSDNHQELRKLGKVYKNSLSTTRFRYDRLRLLVTANSLADKNHEAYQPDDEVSYELKFSPDSEAILAHRVTLSTPQGHPFCRNYSLDCWNDTEKISLESLAAITPGMEDMRELVTFFHPMIQPGSGRYTLRLVDRGVNVLGLFTEPGSKPELLQLQLSRATGTIGQIEIVVRVPQKFGNVKLHSSTIPQIKEMGEAELLAAFPKPIDGFVTLGWKGENFAAQESVEVQLRCNH